MKRVKFQTRFFLYHTGVIFLIVIGLLGYIYKTVVDEMKRRDEQDFRIITQKTVTQLDSLYYNMDRTALQVAANPDIVEMFQRLPADASGNYFIQYPVESGTIKRLLGSYNFKADAHSRIVLYNRYGDFVCTSSRAVTTIGIAQFFVEDTFQEVQEFFSQEGRYIFYKEPSKDVLSKGERENSDCLAVVREIKDYYSGSSSCGYIEVQEPVEKLEEILGDMGTGNYAEILDLEGNLIYRGGGRIEDVDYERAYQVDQYMENAPYMVKFYKSPIELEQELHAFYFILTLAAGAIIAAALLLEHILFRYFSKPLIALDRSLKSVTMENLFVDIADEDSDDIVIRLEDSFNTMLEKLNDSMQMQIAAKTNEVKSHLFALQSQMNPHFLHNILAIISMEAQLNGNTKIPDICRGLGGILRYTSEMGDGYSTIEEECKNAEEYMLLMKVRYEDLFEYEIQVDKEAAEIRIPKLIVQPICENCFQHGFKHVEPIWRIFIHAWTEEGKWYLLIRDNGEGFSDEFLREFQMLTENLEQTGVKDVLDSLSIGGLCIPNIYTRMKITYGKEFIFELRKEETGAAVLFGGGQNGEGIGG